MVVNKKLVVIGIEWFIREYEAKLLLALQLYLNDYHVILLDTHVFYEHSDLFPVCIFLDKSIARRKRSIISKIASKHQFVCYDEEGLAITLKSKQNTGKNSYGEVFLKERYGPENFTDVTKFFTWGNCEYQILKEAYPEFLDKIANTGVPRVELFKKQFHYYYHRNVKAYQKKWGKFVLISSSWNTPKTSNTYQRKFNGVKKFMFDNQDEENNYSDYIKIKEHQFGQFIKIIIKLVKNNPDINFIYRPHPEELRDKCKGFYDKTFKQIKNIQVVFTGEINSWILASIALIHYSCTSGVHSYIMKKPTISLVPPLPKNLQSSPGVHLNNDFESIISNDLSYKCQNLNDCQSALDLILSGDYNFIINNDLTDIINNSSDDLRSDILIANELNTISVPPIDGSQLNKLLDKINKTIKAKSNLKFPNLNPIDVRQNINDLLACDSLLKSPDEVVIYSKMISFG